MLALADVSRGLERVLIERRGGPDPERGFSRVIIDSRHAGPGDLFLALRGEHHDGHDFLSEAIGRGASGVIVSCSLDDVPEGVSAFHVTDTLIALQQLAAYWRGRHDVRVVGITGSVGKTSQKEVIAALLTLRYPVLKNEANLNTEIGLPLTLLQLTGEQRWAVLEMAMYGRGEIALLCHIARPHIGVVTNIGPVHLERLGSLATIVAAKGELVEALPPEGQAVLNGDDPLVRELGPLSKAPLLWYGTAPHCQLRASEITSRGLEGISFRLTYGEASAQVSTPLPGRHHVYPALAAAAVALNDGWSLTEVAEALAAIQPLLRLTVVAGPRGSTILDDSYNASPASVLAALDLLSELKGRRLALLGDMLELGAAEEEGHRQVGERAAQVCHALLLLGERARIIAEAAKAGGLADVRMFLDKEQATTALKAELGPGDYLLVKASRALALETVVAALKAS